MKAWKTPIRIIITPANAMKPKAAPWERRGAVRESVMSLVLLRPGPRGRGPERALLPCKRAWTGVRIIRAG
ncbi:hypothetical protein GCM10009725_01270 [Aeromicrobium tamlense]